MTCVCRRIFERLVSTELPVAVRGLSDYQGGFRAKRGTLDMAFCLQEIMASHPSLINVFLDLKAAYDLVDRRILWARLSHRFHVSRSIIALLQELFDHNVSVLVVNGSRSEPLGNLRGLLQGSSLSPILFNFFINEMIDLLSDQQVPKVTTSLLRTNALFFADDANLHALSHADMVQLLAICEDWSTRVGMRFAPLKCAVLARSQQVFHFCGAIMPQVLQFPYLGMIFDHQGIAWKAHVSARCQKANGVIVTLAKSGLNGSGWPYRSSSLVYKTFIRPIIEYGISLTVLEPKVLAIAQKTQNLALRTIFSASRNTSIFALHKLLRIEPMAVRNFDLNARFACKLHNSLNATIPAVNFWWNRIGDDSSLPARTVKKNPWWSKTNRINHLFNRRSRNPVQAATPLFMPDARRSKLKVESFSTLDAQETSVAGVIQVEPTDSFRHAMLPNAFPSREERITITRWLIGNIVRHQSCLKCDNDTQLSRLHAVACSGAQAYLAALYHEHFDPALNAQVTCIDQLLNKFRNAPPHQDFYKHVHHAIKLIYVHCLGFRQKPNGFWEKPPDDDDDAPLPPGPRIRPPAQPLRITLARAAKAAERNRPLGRPRKKPVVHPQEGIG